MPKISQLTTTTTLNDADTVMVLQSGANKKASVKTFKDSVAGAFTALSTNAWDAATEGNKRTKTLTGNTAVTITGAPTNFEGLLEVTQDSTGNRTLTINGTAVTIKSAANATTMIGILNVGGTLKYYPEGSGTTSGGGGTTGFTFANTEASDYFTRLATAGYTGSTTEKQAYDTFVTSAKTNGYYSLLKLLYLYLGNAATPALVNAISASYTGVNHGATFNASGLILDGTTSYVDAGIVPSTNMTLNNTSMGAWLIGNITSGGWDMISAGGGTGYTLGLRSRYTDNNCYSQHHNTANTLSAASPGGDGFWVTSRINSTSAILSRNGTTVASSTVASTGNLPTSPIFIGANGVNATVVDYCNRAHKMTFAGAGLTSAQVTSFYNDINTFLTAIGR